MSEESFYPKGALAFLGALLAFFALLWFVLYFEILARG
ncbi:MAG: cytochrome c oxidase subunit 2A [Bacteroidetes bacterium]|nr:cytochrome c oxidase subunit 2A [Rhodothermia bacterium]MCS7155457.1 cytochrome c oxidase subunit 2A [Bacteroidota bacterium]MCX7907450.1 cytochrome c oxidase subunit 2A [Bacteroidota bacterium]MDW8138444.1 cytochrome c oxidase subunit 2A [Bacteroidota bacterium]MDW8284619.1 cytochrome c oxidase subunit 2A [Bacteroidota bacterium]